MRRIEKEFTDATRHAERGLRDRDAAELTRQSEHAWNHVGDVRLSEQPSATINARTDRESVSQGR